MQRKVPYEFWETGGRRLPERTQTEVLPASRQKLALHTDKNKPPPVKRGLTDFYASLFLVRHKQIIIHSIHLAIFRASDIGKLGADSYYFKEFFILLILACYHLINFQDILLTGIHFPKGK